MAYRGVAILIRWDTANNNTYTTSPPFLGDVYDKKGISYHSARGGCLVINRGLHIIN